MKVIIAKKDIIIDNILKTYEEAIETCPKGYRILTIEDLEDIYVRTTKENYEDFVIFTDKSTYIELIISIKLDYWINPFTSKFNIVNGNPYTLDIYSGRLYRQYVVETYIKNLTIYVKKIKL